MGGVYKLKSPSLLFHPSIKTCYDIAWLLRGDEFYANKDGQDQLQAVVDGHIQIGEKPTTSELGRVLDFCYMLL